jgi:hypothetical protein
MPRVTTGNTMAPCVVIGEKAAEFLNEKHAWRPKRIDSDGHSFLQARGGSLPKLRALDCRSGRGTAAAL